MSETVITAKLVRGKTYSFNHKGQYITFMRNVPKEVTEDLADALEELIDTVPTSDGDEIEKPLFDIDREAVRRDADEERPSKLRMRLVPATAKAAPEKKSAVRRPIRK